MCPRLHSWNWNPFWWVLRLAFRPSPHFPNLPVPGSQEVRQAPGPEGFRFRGPPPPILGLLLRVKFLVMSDRGPVAETEWSSETRLQQGTGSNKQVKHWGWGPGA